MPASGNESDGAALTADRMETLARYAFEMFRVTMGGVEWHGWDSVSAADYREAWIAATAEVVRRVLDPDAADQLCRCACGLPWPPQLWAVHVHTKDCRAASVAQGAR